LLLLLAAASACDDDDTIIDRGAGNQGGSGGGTASAGTGGGAGAADAGGAGDAGVVGRADPCRGIVLPEEQHYVAPGLCARAVAVDQDGLRQISFASNGDLIGVRTSGEVLRFRDVDADGMYEGTGEIVQIADTGGNGNNAHLDEAAGYLYAGSPEGVVRWRYSAESADLGASEAVVVDQPSSGTHTYHTTHVYDGWLYVHSGSEDNTVAPSLPEYDTDRSVLKRFRLAEFQGTPFAWTSGEVFVLGLRNMVGYTADGSGNLYGVVNGIDELRYRGQDVHLDNPGEDLIRLVQGEAHGYPYCFTAQNIVIPDADAGAADAGLGGAGEVVAAGTQLAADVSTFDNPHDDAWCEESSVRPNTFLEAHSAPLDITFYTDASLGALPPEWEGGAFVTQHGSWNTDPSVGHRVLFVPFDEEGNPPMPTASSAGTSFPFSVVFGGGSSQSPQNGSWGWSSDGSGEDPVRPVGVAVSPTDGALYVSTDASEGYLYRIGRPLE
jgi:glucose/arabinose dehydrogenase